jgi:hypothetical protein
MLFSTTKSWKFWNFVEKIRRKYFQLHVIDFAPGESSLKYVFGFQAKSTSLLLSVQSFCYLWSTNNLLLQNLNTFIKNWCSLLKFQVLSLLHICQDFVPIHHDMRKISSPSLHRQFRLFNFSVTYLKWS